MIHDSNTYDSDTIDKGPGGTDPDPDPDNPSDKWTYKYTTYFYSGTAKPSPRGSVFFPNYLFQHSPLGAGSDVPGGDEAYLKSHNWLVYDSGGVVGIFSGWDLDPYWAFVTSGKFYFEDVFHNLTYTSFFDRPGKLTNEMPHYPEDYPTW